MKPLVAYWSVLKPERTFANVMTTGAGLLYASAWHIDWFLAFMTIVGTSLVVMSACAANNYLDRNLDAYMPRTKKRPLVTGTVLPGVVVALAVVLGLVGFTLLLAYVNWLTALLGLIGYIDYVVLYGWTKRTSVHSTLVGTISGAIPIVAGYTAVTGQLDTTALLLGLAMVFWQMPHFYAIGIFRLEDYRAGNLPIWPVRYGVRSTQMWMLVYTVLYLAAVVALAVAGAGWVFGVVMGLVSGYWLGRGVAGLRSQEPITWARGMFGLSLVVLLVFSAAVAAAPLLP